MSEEMTEEERTSYWKDCYDRMAARNKDLSAKLESQQKTIDDLISVLEEGEQVNTPGLMEWVADRLVHVHDENPNVDYILTLRSRADKIRKVMAKAREI